MRKMQSKILGRGIFFIPSFLYPLLSYMPAILLHLPVHTTVFFHFAFLKPASGGTALNLELLTCIENAFDVRSTSVLSPEIYIHVLLLLLGLLLPSVGGSGGYHNSLSTDGFPDLAILLWHLPK